MPRRKGGAAFLDNPISTPYNEEAERKGIPISNTVAVLGSFVVDLGCMTPRVPRPGETLRGGPFRMGPGGKGSNQAIAAHRAGAQVRLITQIGRDELSRVALELYERDGISTEYVYRTAESETGVALILVSEDDGQNSIVVAPGACLKLTRGQVRRAESAIASADVFLTQWETSEESVDEGLRLARHHGVTTVFNPAPLSPMPLGWLTLSDVLVPNETEAAGLSGLPVESEADIRACAGWFSKRGVKHVVLTLGARGAFLKSGPVERFFPALRLGRALDTTGAGDCFCGALCCALAQGMGIENACRFGNTAAALCVMRRGTAPAMPYRREIDEQFPMAPE